MTDKNNKLVSQRVALHLVAIYSGCWLVVSFGILSLDRDRERKEARYMH